MMEKYTFTLSRNFDNQEQITGRLTAYKNGSPFKSMKIEASTDKEFHHIAHLGKQAFLHDHSDEVSKATAHE